MSLRTAWESLHPRSSVSYRDFCALAQRGQVHDIFLDGLDVGAILVIGPEIHACIKPAGFGRWFNKRAKAILTEVIARHGHATTTVTAGNETGHRFVTRLGFDRIDCGAVWKYRKEK